jgi:hypothetical protein
MHFMSPCRKMAEASRKAFVRSEGPFPHFDVVAEREQKGIRTVPIRRR